MSEICGELSSGLCESVQILSDSPCQTGLFKMYYTYVHSTIISVKVLRDLGMPENG